jgi:hypothetical protein
MRPDSVWAALRPYLLWLVVVWGLPILAAGPVWLVADGPTESSCDGIGFGCSPAANQMGWLLLALATPVLWPLGLAGLAVIAVVRHRRARVSAPRPARPARPRPHRRPWDARS